MIPSLNGLHFVVVGPSMFKGMQLTPRERWKVRYREDRMRAKSYPENAINPLAEASAGCFEGVRIVGKRAHK